MHENHNNREIKKIYIYMSMREKIVKKISHHFFCRKQPNNKT